MSRNRALKARNRINQELPGNTIEFVPAEPKISHKIINLVPRSRNQETLVLALQDPNQHIVVTVGPAGTGKTYMAMQAAVKYLREGSCDRIVMTRPAVGVEDEKHGFLPGNLIAKMEPWTRPLLDVLREHYRPRDIAGLFDDQILEVSPLAFMRGRNFRNSWIIADEMQNATPAQVKMLLTRIGSGTKIILTGDVEQADRRNNNNGLLDLVTRLQQNPIPGIAVCVMNQRDVQRHKIIAPILNLYGDGNT